jgi:hypothetical protein
VVVEVIYIDYVFAIKAEDYLPVGPDLDGIKILKVTPELVKVGAGIIHFLGLLHRI